MELVMLKGFLSPDLTKCRGRDFTKKIKKMFRKKYEKFENKIETRARTHPRTYARTHARTRSLERMSVSMLAQASPR
jgi:hypothetical protein